MAALAYSSAVQARIARNLGLNYATTDSFNQNLIDGATTTALPGGGCALDAINMVRQRGQWFSMTAPSGVPDTFEPWLVALTTLMAGKKVHPERVEEYRRQLEDAESTAIDAYATIDMTAEVAAESYTFSVANVRGYVIRHCVRMQRWQTVDGTARLRPRLWVPVEIVDAQLERVLKSLWARANWPFRRRAVTLVIKPYSVTNATYTNSSKTITSASGFATTIVAGATVHFLSGTGIVACERIVVSATASTVVLNTAPLGVSGDLTTGDIECVVVNTLVDGLTSSEKFAAVASREFVYSDATGPGCSLTWSKDGTTMSANRAWDAANVTTGRPSRFRFENNATGTGANNADVFAWTHSPIPDQTYYAKGEVYVKGPTVTTLAATTAEMARFPAEFDHVIKDLVLAEVLRHYGAPEARELSATAEKEVETLLPQFCDVGVQDDEQEVRDVYDDFAPQRTGWPAVSGGGFGGGL